MRYFINMFYISDLLIILYKYWLIFDYATVFASRHGIWAVFNCLQCQSISNQFKCWFLLLKIMIEIDD